MTNSVTITEKKIEKCRHDGPARVQFLVQEVAYTETGRAWPCIIDVIECPPRQARGIRSMLGYQYDGRVVPALDLSPLVPSLF